MILAGDIGGTNARLAFFSIEQNRLKCKIERVYPTRDFSNLESVVRAFLKAEGVVIHAACFGVAGPVRDGHVAMPNLGWIIDASSMSREVGIETVSVINDLEANAFGVHTLAPEDFASLSDGNPNPRGNTAVISAGTGLGEAGLFFDGKSHHPFACEGGHADFAPIDDLQTEMLTWMRKQLSHVSWERIVSGGGIFHIYRFLRETGRGEEPAWLTEELTKGDPTIPVVQAAL